MVHYTLVLLELLHRPTISVQMVLKAKAGKAGVVLDIPIMLRLMVVVLAEAEQVVPESGTKAKAIQAVVVLV